MPLIEFQYLLRSYPSGYDMKDYLVRKLNLLLFLLVRLDIGI